MSFHRSFSLRARILSVTVIPFLISAFCIFIFILDRLEKCVACESNSTITYNHPTQENKHNIENSHNPEVLKIRDIAIFIFLSSLSMAVFFAFFISSSVALPLSYLTKALTEISKGNVEVLIPQLERRDEIGKIARAAEVFKANTKELMIAKQNAESANHAKSEFLANMSHELRTPMHAILSYTEIIIDRHKAGKDLSKLNQYLDNIYHSSARLLKLVNNLLDLSKLEAGAMEPILEACDIVQLITQALNELSSLIDDKKLNISFSHIISNPVLALDHQMTTRLIINLLSNAIKFAPLNSMIKINVTDTFIENEGYVRSAVAIEMIDQGMGIPISELDQIFNKFVQSSKTKKGNGGTGLGLAICLNIVKLHKGQIWAENHIEGGAIFKVMLPRGLQEI